MKQRRPGQEIKKLLQQGLLPKEIKRLLLVHNASVRYWAIKLGLPYFRRGHDFRANARETANAMKQEGKTYREIGEALGVSRQRAHQYISK